MHDRRMLKFKQEQKASFAQNVIILAIAQIAVKVLGLVYKIVIVNIPGFGNAGSGYYSTGYQIYLVLLAVSSIGIPNVVSKMVSERTARGDYAGADRVFKITFRLVSAVGFLLALLLFVFAKPLSLAFFGQEGVAYTLMALSPAVWFVSSNSVLRGYFTGLGSLKSTSISEIIEQIFNCVLSILFVFLAIGKDTAIMAAAGNISTTFAAFISLSYMFLHYFRRRAYIKIQCKTQTVKSDNASAFSVVKLILSLAIPASFASLVSTLSGNIDSVTVKDMELYGLMSKTETITHLPLALGATLLVAMVPVISSSLSVGDKNAAQEHVSRILFVSNSIMLPCAAGFIALADPILKLLYPNVSDGAFILVLQTVAMIFSSVTFVLNGAFYGMGKQRYPAIILLSGTVLKLILNLIALRVFDFGIVGAVVSTIIYQAAVTVAEWIVLQRYMKIHVEIKRQFLFPVTASVGMGIAVYFIYKISVSLGNTAATLLSICAGVLIYLVAVLKLKMFTEEDYLTLPAGNKILAVLKKFNLA